jgi:uncharacterized protein (TIGR03083 family)
MAAELDYLGHIVTESARFASALRETEPDVRVPSCPDWSSDDLLWHLTEVQWFWGKIVREGLSDPADVEALDIGNRPSDRRAVFAFYERVGQDLVDVLTKNPADTPVWTWSDDHSVGFIRRRQAHEALIHRVDAELTAGDRTPLSTRLSNDGVDEALRVMFGGVPDWGEFTPNPAHTMRFRTTDIEASWLAVLGRFTGTDPDSADAVDDHDLRVREVDAGDDVAATVSGASADLDCWLWNRPPLHPVEATGAPDVLAAFEAMRAHGIN